MGSPAEFANPGDVVTVPKNGTNSLHGDAFWYHQNAALDAIPFGAASKPSKVANDFGGSAGGPVVIPHLYNGKNKTFFYGTFRVSASRAAGHPKQSSDRRDAEGG